MIECECLRNKNSLKVISFSTTYLDDYTKMVYVTSAALFQLWSDHDSSFRGDTKLMFVQFMLGSSTVRDHHFYQSRGS